VASHTLVWTYTSSFPHSLLPPSGDKDGHRTTTVLATLGPPPDRQQEISYTDFRIIGNGSFGVVYQARLLETNDLVAIKKVLQDKRFKVGLLINQWGGISSEMNPLKLNIAKYNYSQRWDHLSQVIESQV